MIVEIEGKKIGGDNPCYLTFEAGPTHSGLDSAMRLADLAADSGADAIKFQLMDPARLVADTHQPFTYMILVDRESGEQKQVEEPLYDILKRRSLAEDEWRTLKAHCDARDLTFFATAFYEEEVDFLVELGCPSIKIASADVNHFPLISHAASKGLTIQLDTGNASLDEVKGAVEIVRAAGNEQIIIHHCPSGYPARLEGVNLRVLSTLKEMFPYPIAFSDHSPGWEMDLGALALGAKLIEKTITEDRTTPSVEHIMSVEGKDIFRFVQTIRDVEVAMGSSDRVMSDAELEKRLGVRRSAYLTQPAKSGMQLGDLDVDFRRPGYGIGPDKFDTLRDKRLNRDLSAGDRIEEAHLK